MRTILVVDDEELVRNFVVRVLTTEDYRVLEADNAAEALEVSNQFEKIDMVITDHALKTMTGRQLVERLCQARPHLKVLHMSGYPIEHLMRDGVLAPGTAFLAKPFVRAQLVTAVRQLLDEADQAKVLLAEDFVP